MYRYPKLSLCESADRLAYAFLMSYEERKQKMKIEIFGAFPLRDEWHKNQAINLPIMLRQATRLAQKISTKAFRTFPKTDHRERFQNETNASVDRSCPRWVIFASQSNLEFFALIQAGPSAKWSNPKKPRV